MTETKFRRSFFFLAPAVIAIFAVIIMADLLRASGEAGTGNGDELVIVADTTASMQPELDALAAAWPGSVIPVDGLDRLFHLVQYKDAVQYKGSTDEINQVQSWLQELTAAGGGDCEDAMLQAIAAAARGVPESRMLLLSDSAPQGGRANLAFIMNKLVERGINIYPVISDWCSGAELSQSAMFSLARMTGGLAHIQEEDESDVAVRGALNMMALADTMLVENATVDGIKVYPLTVDNTVTTLGVDEEKCRVWCLTCTLAVNQAASLFEVTDDIILTVKDPNGNLLQAGDPGVEVNETSGGASYLIDVAEVYTPSAGETSAEWEIIVEGSGDFVLSAAGQTGLHMAYLGKHVLSANDQQILRARLTTDSGSPAVDESNVQFYLKHIMNGQVFPIDLYDDGQHGDGQAGDGIYGGLVVPKRGLWYLGVGGKLANGAEFQREDSVPIRVKGFRTSQPPDNQQVPGNSSTIHFSLTNDDAATGLNQASSKQYELQGDSLYGWANVDNVPASIVLAPGETAVIDIQVNVPADAALGAVEETFLTIVEDGDIGASDTLTVKTTAVDELLLYLPNIARP